MSIPIFVFLLMLPQLDFERDWLLFADLGAGLGFMDHTLDDGLEEEYFELDTLRRSSEQGGLGYRIGFGREITGDLNLLLYGGGSALFPGMLFDNHGPSIPPELTYSLKEKLIGVEMQYDIIRLALGYSFYSGEATLFPDKRNGEKAGSQIWEGDLENTSSFHLIAGLMMNSPENNTMGNLSIIYRDIPLDFPETLTGVDPDVFSRSMVEIRLSLHVQTEIF